MFEWAEMLRASRRHLHLCLWSTMHILALYSCWWSKFNYSQKVITKCDGIITNYDSLVYYKVRWTFVTNCDSFFSTKCDTVYYKLRQVLQSAMIITNCDSTLYMNRVRSLLSMRWMLLIYGRVQLRHDNHTYVHI